MTALIIANTQIRRDVAGRYCLNDLHQASGGDAKHRPGQWLRLQQTDDLVEELRKTGDRCADVCSDAAHADPVLTVEGGIGQGTYAVKELVYSYAMWISAAFHLHVIRAYDALVTAPPVINPGMLAGPQHRADQLVGAGRIFSAALRTARQLRMPPARAMRAAFDCAQRNTGVDWAEELGAEDALAEADTSPLLLGVGDFPERQAILDWLADQSVVTIDSVINGIGGESASHVLRLRVGSVLSAQRWRKTRPRSNGGRFVYTRRDFIA